MKVYSTDEAAKMSGLTTSTIRNIVFGRLAFQIIPLIKGKGAGHANLFSEGQILQLAGANIMRKLGFTWEAIQEYYNNPKDFVLNIRDWANKIEIPSVDWKNED